MATTIIPVDQSKYSRIMIVQIEPKMALEQVDGEWREAAYQSTSSDGAEKQWNVEVVLIRPSKYGNRSETATVTVTGPDPSSEVTEGERVEFDNLEVSIADPTVNKDRPNRVRGGRVNWSADGVRSMAPSGSYASSAGQS